MSFAAKSMMRSLVALMREADYELKHTIRSGSPAYGTFTALLANSNGRRPVGWFGLKTQARIATEALQKEEEVDARIAFTLLLERLDEADKPPFVGRGCSADLVILEEAHFLEPAMGEAKSSGVEEMD